MKIHKYYSSEYLKWTIKYFKTSASTDKHFISSYWIERRIKRMLWKSWIVLNRDEKKFASPRSTELQCSFPSSGSLSFWTQTKFLVPAIKSQRLDQTRLFPAKLHRLNFIPTYTSTVQAVEWTVTNFTTSSSLKRCSNIINGDLCTLVYLKIYGSFKTREIWKKC